MRPDEAAGSVLQPHEGADASDKQGGRLCAHLGSREQMTSCGQQRQKTPNDCFKIYNK